MSRKSKLQHQFIMELKRETKFGESKHRAKEQARRYIPEYVDELRDKGLSEWTIHSYAYALRCTFHCEISELGITLGTRSRADVIRNREAADSALRNDERYEMAIVFLVCVS